MNISKQILTIARASYRNLSHGPKVTSRFRKLKSNQKKFQVDDGNPIYLKSGIFDKLLYNSTLFMSLFGVGWSCTTFMELLFK